MIYPKVIIITMDTKMLLWQIFFKFCSSLLYNNKRSKLSMTYSNTPNLDISHIFASFPFLFSFHSLFSPYLFLKLRDRGVGAMGENLRLLMQYFACMRYQSLKVPSTYTMILLNSLFSILKQLNSNNKSCLYYQNEIYFSIIIHDVLCMNRFGIQSWILPIPLGMITTRSSGKKKG